MSGVVYDVELAAVASVISQVGSGAASVQQQGSAVVEQGQSIPGLCGTAQGVGAAFSALWAPRAETGVKTGIYGQGCAGAVSQACAAVTSGDSVMAQASTAASGVVGSAARFGAKGA